VSVHARKICEHRRQHIGGNPMVGADCLDGLCATNAQKAHFVQIVFQTNLYMRGFIFRAGAELEREAACSMVDHEMFRAGHGNEFIAAELVNDRLGLLLVHVAVLLRCQCRYYTDGPVRGQVIHFTFLEHGFHTKHPRFEVFAIERFTMGAMVIFMLKAQCAQFGTKAVKCALDVVHLDRFAGDAGE